MLGTYATAVSALFSRLRSRRELVELPRPQDGDLDVARLLRVDQALEQMEMLRRPDREDQNRSIRAERDVVRNGQCRPTFS